MFGRNKVAAVKPPGGKAEPPKAKAKPLSPKDALAGQIEQLVPGQSLSYITSKTYGGYIATIELNPQYPTKGRKFMMSTQSVADDKTSGQKNRLWDSDKAKDIAVYILDREGKPFTPVQ